MSYHGFSYIAKAAALHMPQVQSPGSVRDAHLWLMIPLGTSHRAAGLKGTDSIKLSDLRSLRVILAKTCIRTVVSHSHGAEAPEKS